MLQSVIRFMHYCLWWRNKWTRPSVKFPDKLVRQCACGKRQMIRDKIEAGG